MLDIPLATANALSNAASLALVVGTVLVLAGTVGTIWTASVKERYADERITANESLTASAQADAENAKADAAKAHESTELLRQSNLALQADVERERSERLKLEGRLAPRHLSNAQRSMLISTLNSFSGQEIAVISPMQDLEANAYAIEFSEVLRSAGWKVSESYAAFVGSPMYGVFIVANEDDARGNRVPAAAETLKQALMGLGLLEAAIANTQVNLGEFQLQVRSKRQ